MALVRYHRKADEEDNCRHVVCKTFASKMASAGDALPKSPHVEKKKKVNTNEWINCWKAFGSVLYVHYRVKKSQEQIRINYVES